MFIFVVCFEPGSYCQSPVQAIAWQLRLVSKMTLQVRRKTHSLTHSLCVSCPLTDLLAVLSSCFRFLPDSHEVDVCYRHWWSQGDETPCIQTSVATTFWELKGPHSPFLFSLPFLSFLPSASFFPSYSVLFFSAPPPLQLVSAVTKKSACWRIYAKETPFVSLIFIHY